MTDGPLAGRVAVVSGGGRGLGRSFCLALARQGAKVVVSNRNRVTDAAGRGPADRVVSEIAAAGGEAVADYSDAADPAGGETVVAAAVQRWGRLDICVANSAIGTAGMFHKQPAAQFGEVLEVNLHGSVRLARAAMAVMRPAGFGRIILVASAGGLHGDVGLSACAASKGGLLAFGRSLAAEGAGRGVLTNMLLPYALTQMTENQMTGGAVPAGTRALMEPDLVAPVLTALASPECRLNGEYIVTGGGRLRRACAGSGPTRPTPGGCSTAACGATPGTRTTSATPWFGLWLLACSHWLGVLLVASPVYMTNMLVRHTGKRLLEKHMARSKRAACAEYVRRTSGFIPWPPR